MAHTTVLLNLHIPQGDVLLLLFAYFALIIYFSSLMKRRIVKNAITSLPTSDDKSEIPKVLTPRELAKQYFAPYEIKSSTFPDKFESLANHCVQACDSVGMDKATRIMSGRVLSVVTISKVNDDREIYVMEFPKLGVGPIGIRIGKHSSKHYFLGFVDLS